MTDQEQTENPAEAAKRRVRDILERAPWRDNEDREKYKGRNRWRKKWNRKGETKCE